VKVKGGEGVGGRVDVRNEVPGEVFFPVFDGGQKRRGERELEKKDRERMAKMEGTRMRCEGRTLEYIFVPLSSLSYLSLLFFLSFSPSSPSISPQAHTHSFSSLSLPPLLQMGTVLLSPPAFPPIGCVFQRKEAVSVRRW
jgi:hypothetical protein